MPELASDCSADEQVEEMALSENRFDVAAEKVEHEDISKKMPRVAVKKRGGDELP